MALLPTASEQPTVPVELAAKALGIGRATAYRAARENNSIGGVPIIRTRNRITVPTAALRRILGLDPDVAA